MVCDYPPAYDEIQSPPTAKLREEMAQQSQPAFRSTDSSHDGGFMNTYLGLPCVPVHENYESFVKSVLKTHFPSWFRQKNQRALKVNETHFIKTDNPAARPVEVVKGDWLVECEVDGRTVWAIMKTDLFIANYIPCDKPLDIKPYQAEITRLKIVINNLEIRHANYVLGKQADVQKINDLQKAFDELWDERARLLKCFDDFLASVGSAIR